MIPGENEVAVLELDVVDFGEEDESTALCGLLRVLPLIGGTLSCGAMVRGVLVSKPLIGGRVKTGCC